MDRKVIKEFEECRTFSAHDMGAQAVLKLRKSLDDDSYMSMAVDALARNLCIELMENEYGTSFH